MHYNYDSKNKRLANISFSKKDVNHLIKSY